MAESKEKTKVQKKESDIAHRTLIGPQVTEAATAGLALNKYVFKVYPGATKQQIKKSVEDIYGVTVTAVNTVNLPRKFRNYGRTPGWKAGYKKAVVTLKEGDSIELFKGV
jgi:large subunit ribosomal protein L23